MSGSNPPFFYRPPLPLRCVRCRAKSRQDGLIRQRAVALAELAYERFYNAIAVDLQAGRLAAEQIATWLPEDMRRTK